MAKRKKETARVDAAQGATLCNTLTEQKPIPTTSLVGVHDPGLVGAVLLRDSRDIFG